MSKLLNDEELELKIVEILVHDTLEEHTAAQLIMNIFDTQKRLYAEKNEYDIALKVWVEFLKDTEPEHREAAFFNEWLKGKLIYEQKARINL